MAATDIVLMIVVGCLALLILFMSIRIVRPTEKGVVERFGKYNRTVGAGITFIIPFVDRMIMVNTTERMIDIGSQNVITKDKLNAIVDAVIYYRIQNVENSLYQVNDVRSQLMTLAQTTLRAVIGQMSLTEANENRAIINTRIEEILDTETKNYGVDVLRVELQRIEPPQDVQDSMNKVVKAEQEKIAAQDLATATETKADGEKRAYIKVAEGKRQSEILEAEGHGQAIERLAKAEAMKIEALAAAEANRVRIVNEAIQKHFRNEAQTYKALETFRDSFENGTKYVIDSKSNLVNVMSEMAGTNIVPLKQKGKKGPGE
ncbi:MAG: SPFH domain-containing protein [Candidatus Micrarchaeia archaeon]|jgi:regulator of protease activity HflC (stomatin/prohibitin superfamily)